MPGITVKPLHKSFQSFGNSSTHSTTYTPYKTDQKAFQNFQSFGNSSTHSTTRITGYQYYQTLITFLVKTFEEVVGATDTNALKLSTSFDETISPFYGQFDGVVEFEEDVPVGMQHVVKLKKPLEETVSGSDTLQFRTLFESKIPVRDEFAIKLIKTLEEVVNPKESSDAYMFDDTTDTVRLKVSDTEYVTDTVKLQISGTVEDTDSVTISVQQMNLAAATNASGYTYNTATNPIVYSTTDPSPTPLPTADEVTEVEYTNPFEPTVILGGTVYATNPSTVPSSYDANTYFVQWVDFSIPGGNTACTVQDFSFNLGFDGGNFSILSQNDIGSLADSVTLFGLSGTIVRDGFKSATNSYGYTSKGIFGSANLNKEFSIITSGNANYIAYTGSQTLYPYNINYDQRPTVWDVARYIAVASGIHLGFHVVDAPYTDTLSQSSLTGLEALSSLASQVGAQLRWSGSNSYQIVYPNHSQGRWELPNHYLLTSDGIEYENILDLGLGVYGTGVLNIPKVNTFTTDSSEVPGGLNQNPIDTIYINTQRVEADDPYIVVDLPLDTEKVYLKTVVAPGQQTSAFNYITSDFNQWFEAPNAATRASYWQTYMDNGALIPRLFIGPDLYPSIGPINNNKFRTYVGIQRRNPTSNYNNARDEERDRQRDLINRMLSNIRYIKTYEGTINCYFFGSIPLPGMWATATDRCGRTVEGIVESVSFSAPGILSIGVAQYLRINFLDATTNYAANPSNFVI